MKLINHANHHFLLQKTYNNFHLSAIDFHCPASNQNWQIVQDGLARTRTTAFSLTPFSLCIVVTDITNEYLN